ncbi:MAG: succinate dehydrogenase assembly factor 4 [Steroidobacteraceae bacterium]
MQPLEESAGAVDSPAPAEGGKGAIAPAPAETGGPTGPEPTRYGDWERRGRCIDF